MRPYRSLSDPANVQDLVGRLRRLQPDSRRQWGTMTPHEMLCHLGDAFLGALGERPIAPVHTWMSRTIVRSIALHTTLPWPQGVKGVAEADPKRDGTRPAEFERDRARALDLLHRFTTSSAPRATHPVFGPLTEAEWLLWGYGHVDHHLRQFGL